MFQHQVCHPQGGCFVTLLNYLSTAAVLAKINKVLKHKNFITLHNFNVLKTSLILARTATVLK